MGPVNQLNRLISSKPGPKPVRGKMNRLMVIVVALLSVLVFGCETMIGGKPRRCIEDWTWAEMYEYETVFKPVRMNDGSVQLSEYLELADRVDYLDAYCKSINAYRGD